MRFFLRFGHFSESWHLFVTDKMSIALNGWRCSYSTVPVVDIPDSSTSGLVPVGRFKSSQEAREYALVVLAMGLDCLIKVEENGYLIHGEEAFSEAIREEFRLYQEEQVYRPTPATVPIFGSGVELALVWVGILLFCFTRQIQYPEVETKYFSSSLGIVTDGEWYRAFTSLFLHGDMPHLLGNAAFGSVFGILVSNSFGPLRGWGLIMLSGFIGNLLNIFIRFPESYFGLGASTAVFGALGLLVGSGLDVAWRERSFRKGVRAFTPLLAGLIIFGMHGIGGPGIDTLAHLTGMVSGISLGLPAAHLLARKAG